MIAITSYEGGPVAWIKGVSWDEAFKEATTKGTVKKIPVRSIFYFKGSTLEKVYDVPRGTYRKILPFKLVDHIYDKIKANGRALEGKYKFKVKFTSKGKDMEETIMAGSELTAERKIRFLFETVVIKSIER